MRHAATLEAEGRLLDAVILRILLAVSFDDGYCSIPKERGLEMVPSSPRRRILYYVIEVEKREFPLVIMSDGTSHWDDHTGRLQRRAPERRQLELMALCGDHDALRELQRELLEFTISVHVSATIIASAERLAQCDLVREMRDLPDRLTGEETQAVGELDSLLEYFFWKEINPLLSQPINQPTA